VKKAWKWALVVLGIPALSLVVLWIDSYYRAVAAIRAEDERLAKDIAAFRARLHPGLPVNDAFLAGSAVAPLSFYQGAEPAKLEEGHSGHQNFHLMLRCDLSGLSKPAPGLKAPESIQPGDAELSGLALTFRTIRECGYKSRLIGYEFETAALWKLEPILAAKLLPQADIRRIAGQLDRAMAARPTFADSVEAEHLMDRAEVLRVLHLKADPTGFIRRPPNWREFFSWRILLVKCLRQLDDDFSALRSGPSDVKFEKRTELTRSELREPTNHPRWYDLNSLGLWTLARVGTAIVLFRAEKRREPQRLQDLVPDYLPSIPKNPIHDDELGYVPSIPNGPRQDRINGPVYGIVFAHVGPEFSLEWSVQPK
jgi:hypothetical protein